jgi:3-methyladenine DNA glycosylase AlkD
VANRIAGIVGKIRQDLKQNSDEKTRKSNLTFFKDKIKLYGVKSPLVGTIAKAHFKAIRGSAKSDIFDLCEELWQSGFIEESFVACTWAYSVHQDFKPDDFSVFEKWIHKHVDNWASCDTFCNHTVGTFIEMYPEYLSGLKRWALSKNRWMRRAAAVSLIVPAKQGKFLKDVFEIADILLLDREDMVQKGYGWMLKVAANTHEQEVFDYVMKKKSVMPRTALRYAIEKMPKDLKAKAMVHP